MTRPEATTTSVGKKWVQWPSRDHRGDPVRGPKSCHVGGEGKGAHRAQPPLEQLQDRKAVVLKCVLVVRIKCTAFGTIRVPSSFSAASPH